MRVVVPKTSSRMRQKRAQDVGADEAAGAEDKDRSLEALDLLLDSQFLVRFADHQHIIRLPPRAWPRRQRRGRSPTGGISGTRTGPRHSPRPSW